MFIDEKGKLFGKINIVDICILLVIVIGILGTGFTVLMTKNGNDLKKIKIDSVQSEEVTLELGLKLKEVRDITRDAIIVGDEVFTTSNNVSLGKIKKVESEPSKQNILSDDGSIYSAVVPEKYDVTIYVEVDAVKDARGYHGEEDVEFQYGKYYEIMTTTVKTVPVISSIKEVKDGQK